jgi:hypothetical protein
VENSEFASNFIKIWQGHKLTLDGLYSRDEDDDNSTITGINDTFPVNTFGGTITLVSKATSNQADTFYLLVNQANLKAGYKGNFNEQLKILVSQEQPRTISQIY